MCLSIHQITLLIAIYTVVQGLVVLSLNVVFILVGTGALSDTSDAFVRHASIYLNCPHPAKNISCSVYEPLNPDAVFAYEITYVVLHGFWLAGAVVLLTQLCKKKAWQDYVLWMIACSLLILLDTITGAFYSIDIGKEQDDALSAAVMMTVIAFRGVAFYVLNIVSLALVSYALRDTVAMGATRNQDEQSNKPTAPTAAAIELTQTPDPHSSNDDASLSAVIPAPASEPELNSNLTEKEEEEENEPRFHTGPKPVYLGYQADPELFQRNQQVVSQIQQGPGPDMYRSPSYTRPYPGRRPNDATEYREEDGDYGMYSGSGNEGAIPRVIPGYSMAQRAQNTEPDYQPPYAYDNPRPVHDDYRGDDDYREEDDYGEDDYYPGNMDGPPKVPPRVPARVKRITSSRHSRPMPPTGPPAAPTQEYEKKVPPPVPPKNAPYDVRPFSYVNPSFRPIDHGDVSAMKSHSVDIKKTLVEDLEHLKMMEEDKADSPSREKPAHDTETPVIKSIVNESKREHSSSKSSDPSDSVGRQYDAPYSSTSSRTERRPDQYDDGPGTYGDELMTAV